MAKPLIADLPRDVALSGAYIIRITALDPTTGSAVSGVTIQDVVVTAIDAQGGGIVQITDAPSPYLVPTTEGGSGSGTSAPTPPPPPASTSSGPLHTEAVAVSDPATRKFDLAVADKLEPGGAASVILPVGDTPFHTLAAGITDAATHAWAVAVANIIEP